jgi:hypothetical protein
VAMFPLVEFPEMVQHYAPFFQEVFSAEAFIEFERYISGLVVSENKTVDEINRLFVAESRNQSSLNRLLTESPYSLDVLNQKRLEMLASLPGTEMKAKGVFSLDDTLLSHYGQDFEEIAQLWDYVSGTYVWAHDLVTMHYSDDEPAFCRFLDQTLKLPYVGTLSETDPVNRETGLMSLKDFAAQLKSQHLQDPSQPVFRKITIFYKGEHETYYSYCNTHHLHNFGKQRLVINYRQADLSDNPTFFISNCLYWNSSGITRIRRHRWPVEVFHQEGKAEGLDQYQLRSFSAIQRHIALLAVVYSMLRAAQHDPCLQEKLQRQLQRKLEGSPASWRRASQAQALWCLALFISTGLMIGQPLPQIVAPLLNTICHS